MYKHSYTLCFTELHQAVFSLYDQTNTTSLRGTIVQEPVPMCPSPIVSQSHCAPVPLYTSPTVYYFCRVPAPWSFIALLYPLFLSRCLPVPFVSQPHCVQVPLFPSLVQLRPSPTMSQTRCFPVPMCPSPVPLCSSPVVSGSHCVPVQSRCVPVPLCPSPTVFQSRVSRSLCGFSAPFQTKVTCVVHSESD